MTESSISLGDLMQRLEAKGMLDEPALGRIKEYIRSADSRDSTPWYIKGMIGIGAWVAALSFCQAIAMAELLFRGPLSLCIWGLLLIGSAATLQFLSRRVFVVQLALALSLAGHGLLLSGVLELSHYDPLSLPLAAALLCAILYPIYEGSLHRFLSCFLVTVLFTNWCIQSGKYAGLHVLVLLEMVGTGLILTDTVRLRALRSLGYALAVSLPMTVFFAVMVGAGFLEGGSATQGSAQMQWWPSSAMLALGLIWLYQWIAGGPRTLLREPLWPAVVATVILGAISTPGVLAALGLLVLGHARGERALTGLGLVFFAVFLFLFYYDLNVSLMTKSLILTGSGAVLQSARWFLSRRPWAKEVAS
ncbi:DUF4401 domain-containing protein [Thermodesulfobacteriota bacterium]